VGEWTQRSDSEEGQSAADQKNVGPMHFLLDLRKKMV